MMLWGPVSLPEPEVLVDCLQPPRDSNEKGQQPTNHLSEH